MLLLHAVRGGLPDRGRHGQYPLSVAASALIDDELAEVTTRFRSDDSGVRRVAMMGGAELVGADAAAVLIEGLHDRNAAVREAAARALGEH